MVRECRPLYRHGTGAVRLQPADPQPARQPREPAPARQGVPGGRGDLDRRPRRRPQGGQAGSADVHAVPPARAGTAQPHRRLAHGHVQRRGRRSGRFPSGASGGPGPGRRRPGLYRDDLRDAGGAHHPGLCRACTTRRMCEAWRRDRRLRAPEFAGEDLPAARPIPGRRARPSSAGRRWTRRSNPAIGSCSPPRPSPGARTTRCRAR